MSRKKISIVLTLIGLYLLISPIFDLVSEFSKAEVIVEQPGIEISSKEIMSHTKEEEVTIVPPPYSEGDTIGYLKMNNLKIEWPLIEGINQKYLNKGIGHLEQTAYPNELGTVGLVAFQDNKPIRELYSVDTGELIHITDYESTYVYEVYRKDTIAYKDCVFIKNINKEEIMLVTATKDKEKLFVIYAKRI